MTKQWWTNRAAVSPCEDSYPGDLDGSRFAICYLLLTICHLSFVICHALRRSCASRRGGTFADHQLWAKRSAEYGAWGATDSGEQDVEAFPGHDIEV